MAYNRIDSRAIEMWNNLYSMQMIADVMDVSRHGVKKYLNRHGIDTSNKGGCDVECNSCGVEFKKARYHVRQNIFNYCTPGCYYKSIENPAYVENRQRQRNARKTVRACGYCLLWGEVVHHKDGNTTNNDPNNLMVFACHGDRMRWHRGDRDIVKPLWPKG